MHLLRKALVAASIATTALVVPAAPPALASDCTGSNTFASGTPTVGWGAGTVTATFHTYGPGFIPFHCDLGWIEWCGMDIDGVPVVPVTCTTDYPQPDRCPSSGLCRVFVTAPVAALAPGTVHTVHAGLGMKWGCCGYQGGPTANATGSWTIDSRLVPVPQCDSDLCKKVRPIVKVIIEDP